MLRDLPVAYFRKSEKSYGRPFIEHLKEHLELNNPKKRILQLENNLVPNSPGEWIWDSRLHPEVNNLMAKAYKEGLTMEEKAYLNELFPQKKLEVRYKGKKYASKQSLSYRQRDTY